MRVNSSSEFQDLYLASIMVDSEVFLKTYELVSTKFFDNDLSKIVYKSIVYYYNTYHTLPSYDELFVVSFDMYTNDYQSSSLTKDDFKQYLTRLSLIKFSSREYIVDVTSTFVSRGNLESTISKIVSESNNTELNIEQLSQEIVNSLQYKITFAEPFLLSDSEKLESVRNSVVGSVTSGLVIPSFVPDINKLLTFKGYAPSNLVMICSPPGKGKTMFMINEGVNAASLGFKVLHVFLGDMTEYDGFIRYTSSITGIKQDEIVSMTLDNQIKLVSKYNYQGIFNNIVVKSHPASEITVDQLIKEIYSLQDQLKIHFDMIHVDYAENLVPERDAMYDSGGDIYNKLSLLGSQNKSVVFIGSQPKASYWSTEVIPLEAAAESSKKQHIVDLMLTMGQATGENLLTLNIPKSRRGIANRLIRLQSNYASAKMSQITEEEYLSLGGGK